MYTKLLTDHLVVILSRITIYFQATDILFDDYRTLVLINQLQLTKINLSNDINEDPASTITSASEALP